MGNAHDSRIRHVFRFILVTENGIIKRDVLCGGVFVCGGSYEKFSVRLDGHGRHAGNADVGFDVRGQRVADDAGPGGRACGEQAGYGQQTNIAEIFTRSFDEKGFKNVMENEIPPDRILEIAACGFGCALVKNELFQLVTK